jgi:hypothetical protein
MRNELQRAAFPGLGQRKRAAGRARNRQSLEAGRFEILVEHADRIAPNHVLWSRNGVRGNRHAAGQCLELNDAECVGLAGKHEHVCRRDMGRQGFPFHLTEKVGAWEAALQLVRLRPVADDDLRAGQIERQECRQVLFHRDAADADENWAGQIDCRGALGAEEVGIDAARPHRQMRKAPIAELLE